MTPTFLHLSFALFVAIPIEAQGRNSTRPDTQEGQPGAEDAGVAVRMLESPTLDRFLRKAQEFLAREDHAGAINVLQDVLVGEAGPDAEAGAPGAPLTGEDDPRHAVFSGDGRLYRPVRRLCHEFLASLPEDGIRLYQQMHEVAAEREYRAAFARRDVRGLEAVYNRYFATLAAGKALYAAGELLMHAGRWRAALLTFVALRDLYPEENRARLAGVSPTYLQLRLALCMSRIGEAGAARQILSDLAAADPEGLVRVQGELTELSRLADSGAFSRPDARPVVPSRFDRAALRSLDDGLIPVWQYRYVDPEPYRRPQSNSNTRFTIAQGRSPAAPWYHRHKPGTSVAFDGDALVFLDHFRLRVHEVGSGIVRSQTTESARPPKPRQGRARVRIPVYDWASLRVARDSHSYFCVLGPGGRADLPNLEPILRNRVVCYDRTTLERRWSTTDWKRSERSYEGVTFLATPTVFGDRLLLPILVDGAYGIQGIGAANGEPLFRVRLHFGGSELARTACPPVVVRSGTAYVLTNAGTVASVDAFTGDLNWVRRYERQHPLRPGKRQRVQRRQTNQFSRQYFRHVSLNGFVPSEMVAVEGRLIIAPSDGEVLACLDAASGDVLWLLSKPRGDSVQVVGHNDRYLYVGGWTGWGTRHRPDPQLGCIDLETGVRLWEIDMPESAWGGRGLVTDDRIVLPGSRSLYSLPADGSGTWRKTQLPPFSVGQNPLSGEMNLFASGPYLVACYAGGIEVFASLEALRELAMEAADPLERADFLVQAGDLIAAIDAMAPLCTDGTKPAAERKKITKRALALVRHVVLDRSDGRSHDTALQLLDRAGTWVESRDLRLQWQLLKVEFYQALGDRDAVDREQDVLYEMMEGKRP